MPDVEKLHNRARLRYLEERRELLRSPSPIEDRFVPGSVVEVVLRDVERFVPDDFSSWSETSGLLAECADETAVAWGRSERAGRRARGRCR